MRAWVSWTALLAVAGCFPDWDSLDPSQGDATTTASTGGAGGTGANGGGGTSSTGGQGGTPSGGAGGNEGGGGMAPIGPWTSPQIVPELSHPEDDDDPSITADGLELFINSGRDGDTDIFVSTRATVSDPWSTPANVVELNSPATETNHTIAPDGLTIWFKSSRADPMASTLVYVSTRATRSSTWTLPVVLTEVENQNIDDVSGVTADGLLMIGHGPGSGMTSSDLYQLERPDTMSPWGPKLILPELNSDVADNESWMSADGLTVFISSPRAGSLGSSDLWSASRASLTAPFSTPQNEVMLNYTGNDSDPTLTPDLRTIYFARPVGMDGEREIFVSTR